MKSLIAIAAMLIFVGAASAVEKGDSADPVYGVSVLPQSNRSAAAISADAVASTFSVSAVAISSSVPTRIDTAFNAVALAALGANYQRAEIAAQNNGSATVFCGSSPSLTVASGFAIYGIGGERNFELGKNIAIYCINTAGSAGTLIVGGVAWK